MRVAGMDLAAKGSKCTGYTLIDVDKSSIIDALCLYSDDNIIKKVIRDNVVVIAIDAPIIKDPKMRNVDRAMIRRGFKVFPPNFSWMKMLSIRAYRITSTLHKYGIKVIETHPRSALINSRCKNIHEVLKFLKIRIDSKYLELINSNKDLRDAAICACVAYLYVNEETEAIIENDGVIYLMKPLC